MKDTTASALGNDVQTLLKAPIEEECYMINYSWWKDLSDFLFSPDGKSPEPGVICNLELVYFRSIYIVES